MTMVNGMTTGKQRNDNASIDQVLAALDAEADSLPPEIGNSLAFRRRQAIRQMQRQSVAKRGTVRHREPKAGLIRNAWQTLHCNGPMTTALASVGIASLTTLMIFSGGDMQNSAQTPVETTPSDNTPLSEAALTQTSSPSLQAAAFETESVDHLQLISSEENLDLMKSVDFLLWLDAQQG